MSYWRTASGFEVDFILGAHEVAVECKSAAMVRNWHLTDIRAFKEEHTARRYIVVSMDPAPRQTDDGLEILPWKVFLERLWHNDIIDTA